VTSGKRLSIDPCPTLVSARLEQEVGIGRVLADALTRRGWTDPDEVRAFLDLEGSIHDPLLLADAAIAIPLIQAAIAGRTPKDFAPYSIGASFAVGQLVNHKKFGDGVVMEINAEKKVTVLFEEGSKLLAQAMG
jgi:hypothetical protein